MNGPAHKTLWMMNHREFPLNSMSHIERGRETQEGRGLGEEELVLDEVQVPGKEGRKMRKGRDGPVVGLVVQQHHEASISWA